MAARRGGQVTIKDIAQALGISHATVSRALNDSPLINAGTKDRIRAKADEMGYVPDPAARVMRGELSTIVGFILPDVQNHFYSASAKVLAESVSAAGFQLVLAISEDDPERERRHVEELRRARARGIVITPSAGLLPDTADLLRDMPVVQLVRSHPRRRGDGRGRRGDGTLDTAPAVAGSPPHRLCRGRDRDAEHGDRPPGRLRPRDGLRPRCPVLARTRAAAS